MADFPSTAKLIGIVQAYEGTDANKAAKWFPGVQTQGNSYEFDILTGNRNKAKYRAPDGAAGTQNLIQKVRKEVVLPTIREKKMLKESTLRWLDGAGKHSPEKISVEIAREMKDLDDIIERAHEYARWRLMCTGEITLTGDYATNYNFGLGSSGNASVDWTTAATADPIGDIIDWKEDVEQACGREPDEILLSTPLVKLIFESTKGVALMAEATRDEYRRTGKIKELVGMKVTYINDGFMNDAGTFNYYLSYAGTTARDLVIIKAPGQLGETAEGGVVDSKAPSGHVGKFAKSWEQEDPSGRFVLEAHTALPGLTYPNRVGAFRATGF